MQKRIKTGLEYILLPLFFINITTSANSWDILGISIGQIFFYILITAVTAEVVLTPYRNLGLVLLAFSFLFFFISIFTQSGLYEVLKVVTLGLLFMLAGAKIYGDNPELLYKQLVIFFIISIPFIICQILGLSSFFMMWNTDYTHSLDILDVSELGKFKVIPVYPTLFVGLDELYYQIGQGRPNGLLHSNNILSIFVAISVGLNLITSKSTRLRYSDLIVMCILTLTMSFMAFSVTIMLYVYCMLNGSRLYRIKATKLFATLLSFLALYFIFFPGLFLVNFGEAKFFVSFLTRGLDLANSLGFSKFNVIFSDQLLLIGSAYKEEDTYSQFSAILKSRYVGILLISFLVTIFIFIRGYRYFKKKTAFSTHKFNIFLFCCLFTQFGVPYIVAPSYQFIFGFAVYPLLKKYWSIVYKTPHL